MVASSGATRPTVRVAVGQLEISGDHGANRATVHDAVSAAGRDGADLLVLPEYASGYEPRGVGVEHAEPLDGPFVTALREDARRAGIAVVAGVTLPGETSDRASNAVVAVDAAGELVGVYRKVHLYDAFGHRESDRLEPGAADAPPLLIDVAGLTFGVMTCYDLRFPEMARRVVDAGAQVLVVPAAWAAGEHKALHWRTLALARAIENTSAVVAVGQVGNGVLGRSVVVGPDGVVLLELDDAPSIVTVDLDPTAVDRARAHDPSLANRRYTVAPLRSGAVAGGSVGSGGSVGTGGGSR